MRHLVIKQGIFVPVKHAYAQSNFHNDPTATIKFILRDITFTRLIWCGCHFERDFFHDDEGNLTHISA